MPLDLTPKQPPYYEVVDGPTPTPGALIYRATLTQAGTAAPIPTIMENDFGTAPVWSYSTVGRYLLTKTGAFTENKTYVMIGGLNQGFSYSTWISEDEIQFDSRDIAGTLANDLIGGTTPIEIIVYP